MCTTPKLTHTNKQTTHKQTNTPLPPPLPPPSLSFHISFLLWCFVVQYIYVSRSLTHTYIYIHSQSFNSLSLCVEKRIQQHIYPQKPKTTLHSLFNLLLFFRLGEEGRGKEREREKGFLCCQVGSVGGGKRKTFSF